MHTTDPEDDGLTPLLAIHIAREYADGRADVDDLAAARTTVGEAAGSVWDAGAAWAVWDAGAAGAAQAARDAAGAGAWDAERQWQATRLLHWFPTEEE